MGSAAEEMGKILDRPPAVTETLLRGATRLTERWRHGGLHDYLAPMNSHVIMTYYGETRDIVLKRDG